MQKNDDDPDRAYLSVDVLELVDRHYPGMPPRLCGSLAVQFAIRAGLCDEDVAQLGCNLEDQFDIDEEEAAFAGASSSSVVDLAPGAARPGSDERN